MKNKKSGPLGAMLEKIMVSRRSAVGLPAGRQARHVSRYKFDIKQPAPLGAACYFYMPPLTGLRYIIQSGCAATNMSRLRRSFMNNTHHV